MRSGWSPDKKNLTQDGERKTVSTTASREFSIFSFEQLKSMQELSCQAGTIKHKSLSINEKHRAYCSAS